MTTETVVQEIKTRIRKATKPVIAILLLFVLFSCDSKRVYENYYSNGNEGWVRDSIAVFDVNVEHTGTNFNLLIGCRNLENYPYSNLWLFVDIVSPDSTVLRDTVQYELALPNGKWIGKGTSGVYFNQFTYKRNVFFPVKGNYQVSIQHAMRERKLKGLKDIGLRVEKVK